MRYNKSLDNFPNALGLSSQQVKRLRAVIEKAKANDLACNVRTPDIDHINAFVAPYIDTPEEGFYAGLVIMVDVLSALTS